MGREEPVITIETTSADLFHGGLDVRTDLLRVRLREGEVGDTDPGFVASGGCLQLESLSDLRVLSRFIVSTLDPNDGKGGTCGA